jgi:hypothetical protein
MNEHSFTGQVKTKTGVLIHLCICIASKEAISRLLVHMALIHRLPGITILKMFLERLVDALRYYLASLLK